MPKSAIGGLIVFFVGSLVGALTMTPEQWAAQVNVFSAAALIGAGIFIGRMIGVPRD